MKGTNKLKKLLASYYIDNDTAKLEEIADYLKIDWSDFLQEVESQERNKALWLSVYKSDREMRERNS